MTRQTKIISLSIVIFFLCVYLFNHNTENKIILLYTTELEKNQPIMEEIISFMHNQDSTCNDLEMYFNHGDNYGVNLYCNEDNKRPSYKVEVNDDIYSFIEADWKSVYRYNGITTFNFNLNTDSYKFYPYYLCYGSVISDKDVVKMIKPHWYVIKGENRFSW